MDQALPQAGAHHVERGLLRRQHQFIQVALRRGKAAIDGPGAGDVRGIAIELAASVDQQQFAVVQYRVVGAVVQHAGVGTAGDDGRIGRELRAAAAKLVQQFGFDRVFMQAWAGGAHGAHMGRAGNGGGAPHQVLLLRVFQQAHGVEHGADIDRAGRRQHAAARLLPHRLAPQLDLHVEAAAHGVVDGRRVGQQARHFHIQFLDRKRRIEAEGGTRRFRSVAKAIPDFALGMPGAAKQHGARRRGAAGGHQRQRAVRFGKAAQIVKRAVVAIRVVAIAVARHLGRGGDNGHAAGRPFAS